LNHNISKQLVQEGKQIGADLAFEDLTNIRESLNQKPRSKTERRKTNNWAFYQLRWFVGYKANIAGVKCGHCGREHDADINAANNIAALGKSVSLPESPGMSCQLEGQLSLFPIIQI
jgi:IS605 OrfB family transposase